jgi:hypothetical protein
VNVPAATGLLGLLLLAATTMPAAAQPSPTIDLLVGRGPAPGGDGLLLGLGIHLPLHQRVSLRVLGTDVQVNGSSALQGALLLEATSRRGRARPYAAAGPMFRRVRIPLFPGASQDDTGWGALGVLGGEWRVDRCGRFRLFAEVHGILANGYGGELGGGMKVALYSCRAGTGTAPYL